MRTAAMKLEAYLTSVQHGPNAGQSEILRFRVTYGNDAALLDMRLEQPLEGDTNEALARELHRLGRVLIQVSQSPSELIKRDESPPAG